MEFITALTITCLLTSFPEGTSFAVSPRPSSSAVRPLAMVTRDEYLQPHFEVSTPPCRTKVDMDRITFCAESDGECGVEEVNHMLEDLELFNHECTEVGRSSNPECKLEMEEKRQAIMHELESQIGLVEASHRKKEKEINDHAKASFASQLKRFHDIAEYEEH